MNFIKKSKSFLDTPNRPGRCLQIEKTKGKKSRDTVPLKPSLYSATYSTYIHTTIVAIVHTPPTPPPTKPPLICPPPHAPVLLSSPTYLSVPDCNLLMSISHPLAHPQPPPPQPLSTSPPPPPVKGGDDNPGVVIAAMRLS
jgi:hypothetical protein